MLENEIDQSTVPNIPVQNPAPVTPDTPEIGPLTIGITFFWEVLKVIAISLVIIIPIRYFIVQPFFVHGASMEDTFHDKDYILIDEISYRFKDPARGDIVVSDIQMIVLNFSSRE